MDYNFTYREKNGRIQVIISYKVKNKWKQKSKQGFKKQVEAKRWAQREVRELEGLNLNNDEYHDLTFKQLADIFLDSVRDKYSQNTLVKYDMALKHYSDIVDKKYNKITTFELQRITDNLDMSNISKTTYLRRIKAIFNFAINKLETLARNPTNNVDIEKDKKREYLVITKEEFYNDIYPILQKREDMALLYKIAFSTGLRAGEILGLTYENIKADRIIVDKQWNLIADKKRGFKKLKTKNSYREVPITLKLYNDILSFKSKNLHVSRRLFHMINSAASISQFFNMNMKNTQYAKLRLHDMRHSYVSILIEQGLDFKIIADLIGDSLATVISTYSHVNTESKEKARKIINGYF